MQLPTGPAPPSIWRRESTGTQHSSDQGISVSDSVGLGWGLRMCISIKFPIAAMVWGLRFENDCFNSYHVYFQIWSTTLLLDGSIRVHERTHFYQ